MKAVGNEIEKKIEGGIEGLKASQNFLPKLNKNKVISKYNIRPKNPEVYDFEKYKINAYEDDHIVVKKYKDFMNQPTKKLDRMQKKHKKI